MSRITIHSFKAEGGQRIEYARVWTWRGHQFIGQSLLLCRLSPEQLALAVRA